MSSLGAIGLAISAFTEHAIGAIATMTVLVVTSEVADNVPQFAPIHPYLPTHWWTSFDSLLRVPADTGTLLHGLLSFGLYLLLSGASPGPGSPPPMSPAKAHRTHHARQRGCARTLTTTGSSLARHATTSPDCSRRFIGRCGRLRRRLLAGWQELGGDSGCRIRSRGPLLLPCSDLRRRHDR